MCKVQSNNVSVIRPFSGSVLFTTPSSPVKKSKRVSFNPVVRVNVVQRLDSFATRDLFYQPADFRRFQSEAYIELLEARSDKDREPWKSILRRLKELVKSNQAENPQRQNINVYQVCQSIPVPLDFAQQQQSTQRIAARRNCTAANLDVDSSEKIVRELAFVL